MTTTVWSFTVPGVPVAKGRPRFQNKGGFIRTYTPEKTERYENLVRLAFINTYDEAEPATGPIELEIIAFFPIPKSWSRKKRERALKGEIWKTSRPDLDNIEKAIQDGLNGVAWVDDSQVASKSGIKLYSDQPRVDITITEWKDKSHEHKQRQFIRPADQGSGDPDHTERQQSLQL